ncbi:MAG: hypothetical protein IPK52_25700 [Chloroflexi bacterium]|nr:hypothetical protein [Chloroflexota bacterium]
MRRLGLLLALMISLALVACSNVAPTGDSASDADSAQNQLPAFANYSQTDADSVKDALTRALQAGSLGTGNLIAVGLIERLNTMADCLGNVGAIAGRVYTSINPPVAGLLVVINNETLTNNFMQCAFNPGVEAQQEGRQALQPCAKAGAYTDNGVSYSYIYAATDISMCSTFDGWLATKQP